MALISMMRNKMVIRDKSIEDSLLAEGISLASMLPGPVAVNVVAYTGFHIGGVVGALVSVIAVLIPSFLLVFVLTLIYFQTGSKIYFDSILLGIIPVVVGIIFSVGISMAKKTCTILSHYVILIVSFLILFFLKGYWPIVLVLIGSALAGAFLFKNEIPTVQVVTSNRPWKPVFVTFLVYCLALATVILFSPKSVLSSLIAQFSYISLTLFGGGYVMIPVLKNLLVDNLNWFNDHEFMYGISAGQITPGPILISAVFFGYKMAGIWGSIVATIGIFLPSAILMIILSKIFISVKHNRIVQSALSGLKPAVTGMILYSGLSIFIEHMRGANLFLSLGLAGISFWLVFRFNIVNAIIIIAGGVLGFFMY